MFTVCILFWNDLIIYFGNVEQASKQTKYIDM